MKLSPALIVSFAALHRWRDSGARPPVATTLQGLASFPHEHSLHAGFGFRYLSPIGPLRAELGWKLHRERNPPEGPIVLFVSFGNPF